MNAFSSYKRDRERLGQYVLCHFTSFSFFTCQTWIQDKSCLFYQSSDPFLLVPTQLPTKLRSALESRSSLLEKHW